MALLKVRRFIWNLFRIHLYNYRFRITLRRRGHFPDGQMAKREEPFMSADMSQCDVLVIGKGTG